MPWVAEGEQFHEYRGMHQPFVDPDEAGIHNMEQLFPEDVYTHPHFYAHGEPHVQREAFRQL